MWSFGHWEASANMLTISLRSTPWWSRYASICHDLSWSSWNLIITDHSVTADDLINIVHPAPVRENTNSKPFVIVVADQEKCYLRVGRWSTWYDDDNQKDDWKWSCTAVLAWSLESKLTLILAIMMIMINKRKMIMMIMIVTIIMIMINDRIILNLLLTRVLAKLRNSSMSLALRLSRLWTSPWGTVESVEMEIVDEKWKHGSSLSWQTGSSQGSLTRVDPLENIPLRWGLGPMMKVEWQRLLDEGQRWIKIRMRILEAGKPGTM